MTGKRWLWYLGALISTVAAYLFLATSLRMVWLSAFTNANVGLLRLWFWLYLVLFFASLVSIVFCIKRGRAYVR